MKLAPHLHRIGNDLVAAYLIVTPDGVTVIDAGLPGHWRELLRELRAMGRSLDDVRGVVLTHGDSDHLGFAERLRRATGVPVYIHSADADRARGGKKPKSTVGPMRVAALLRFLGYTARKGGLVPRYLKEVVEVADADVLDLPGSPRVVGMPGHSAGSIAIHIPLADAVCVGDALTTRNVLTGREGLAPAPFTDSPAEALASLERLAELDATWVLPGHGAPWRGDMREVVERVHVAAQGSSASSSGDAGGKAGGATGGKAGGAS